MATRDLNTILTEAVTHLIAEAKEPIRAQLKETDPELIPMKFIELLGRTKEFRMNKEEFWREVLRQLDWATILQSS